MSDKYRIEYLERKSSLNYDEYLENRIAELEAENQRLVNENAVLNYNAGQDEDDVCPHGFVNMCPECLFDDEEQKK